MDESLTRLEARLQRLESVLDAQKTSGYELAKCVKDLQDLRTLFFERLEHRPTIKEGVTKYQKLHDLAESDSNSPNEWNSIYKREVILNELPQLRTFSSAVESYDNLTTEIATISSSLVEILARKDEILQTRNNLSAIEGTVQAVENTLEVFDDVQSEAISLIEAKLMAIDGNRSGTS